jgi:hypothetical protein
VSDERRPFEEPPDLDDPAVRASLDPEWVAMLLPLDKLKRDLKEAGIALQPREVRYLVDYYYAMQHLRATACNQVRALEASGEPCTLIKWLAGQDMRQEHQVKTMLDIWTDGQPVGRWLKSQRGVGPVISAGLMAYIDIERASTVGDIWRHAGLDPTQRWLGKKDGAVVLARVIGEMEREGHGKKRGQDGDAYWKEVVRRACPHAGLNPATVLRFAETDKDGKQRKLSRENVAAALARRPYHDGFKTLCWKAGDCFVKLHNRPDCFYGKVYEQRKELEMERNAAGRFAETAQRTLAEKDWSRDTATKRVYEEGRLPDGRIDLRARRYAVKLFLSHLHEVMFWERFKTPTPAPYVIGILGHIDYIPPPNEHFFPGLREAREHRRRGDQAA